MKPFRLWKRKDRGGVYYYRWASGPWRSTGCTRRGQAETYVLAHPLPDIREAVLLRDFLRPFYTDACPHVARLHAEKKSIGAEHVKHCRALLDSYVLKDQIADSNVGELRRGDILDFRGRLIADGLRDSQVNRILGVLKTCIKEGVHREELERDPTAGVGNISHRPTERGVFTRDELKRLFPPRGLGPWGTQQANMVFLVAATVGARRGEILALRWRDVDLDKNEIHIRQAWKNETELGPPKWGRTREGLPLPKTTADGLRALRGASMHVLPDALVFCTEDGGRLSTRWYQAAFRAAMKRAKIDSASRRLTGHSFRHSLNTILRDQGVPAEKIRAAMGWTNEKTQDGYTHFGVEHLRDQADLVDSLLGGTHGNRIAGV